MKAINEVIKMLTAFEQSINDNAEMRELLRKAINDKPAAFAKNIYDILNERCDALLCDTLNIGETERLLDVIYNYAIIYPNREPSLDDFAEQMSMFYNIDNKYASDETIIHNLFNNKNKTGMEIKTADIIEMTDATHPELKSKILAEMLLLDENNECTGLTFCSLLSAESDTRSMVMLDLHYVDNENDEDLEVEIDETPEEYLIEYPSCKSTYVRDGKNYAFYPATVDYSKYTPLVIDYLNKRVYFSLQGDIKMLLNPDTYDGRKAGHIEDSKEFADEIDE